MSIDLLLLVGGDPSQAEREEQEAVEGGTVAESFNDDGEKATLKLKTNWKMKLEVKPEGFAGNLDLVPCDASLDDQKERHQSH